jgi:hypothetical protein
VRTTTVRLAARRPAAIGLFLAACAVGTGGSGAGLSAAQDPQERPHAETEGEKGLPRYEGEYGLFVQVLESQLVVRWITAKTGPGHLSVKVDGEPTSQHETPSGVSHRVAFPLPEAAAVVLEYGGPVGSPDRHTTTIYLETAASIQEPVHTGVDSLYVVGDTHGRFDTVVQLLGNAGLIDADRRWIGGTKHLVFLGDLFDRGDDVTRLLWFLYGLEREAADAGGRVHVMLGNHELMVMSFVTDYVSQKEQLLAFKLGVEHYAQVFDPQTSVLGRWLAGKSALMRIDEVLLAHGGVSEDYFGYSLTEYQDSLTAFIHEEHFPHLGDEEYWAGLPPEKLISQGEWERRYGFFWGPRSVFWYRDYADRSFMGTLLEKMLDKFDAEVHVIGHTPIGRIQERYEGMLIAVDLERSGSEMLLLLRSGDGRRGRYVLGLTGPPVPLESSAGVDIR